jgi:predicted dehydrogenase
MINIALLSRWHIHATEYAKEAASIDGVKLTAVWDSMEERGKAWSEELGVDFEKDLDKLLLRKDIDAVIISSPTNQHKELMIKAAEAGKHIFTEAVMAPLKKDCEEIGQVIKSNNVKFCISLPKRGYPESLFVKAIIDNKSIGDITLLRIRNAHNGVIEKWLPEYFYDPSTCGGGAMIDIGAHPMYISRWFLGKPKSIISMFNNYTGLEVEDNAVAVIEFENKAIAVVETGFVSTYSPYSLEIYGTKGSIFIGGPENKVMIKSDNFERANLNWTQITQLPQELESPMLQWVNAIKSDTKILYGVEEGIQLTELIEAAYNSYIEGRKIYF